ncbi:MAG: HTTM domain-containing protein [Galactobacter sp.]
MSTAQKNEPERGTSVAAGAGEAAEAARHDVGQSVQVVGVLSLVTRFGRFLASAVKALLTLLGRTTVRVYAFCENWLLDGKKAAHGLAVTRMMFGVVGIGLLATNWRTRLYTFGPGSMWNGEYVASDSDFPRIWAFSLFHKLSIHGGWYTFFYLLLGVLAVLIMLGYRFKLVLPFYFLGWVSFIEANDMLGDQGDNMYRIALLLLFFADPCRVWCLDARRRRTLAALPTGTGKGRRGPWPLRVWRGEPIFESKPEIGALFNNLALIALTAQVCFVYASGALYKAGGKPWQEGWAVYDPLHTVQFGTWPELSTLATAFGITVALASWGSIIIQFCFPAMLLTHPTRVIALIGIMGFHLGIAVLMGLPWFSLAMIAIDFIFVTEKSWTAAAAHTRRLWTKAA